MWSTRGQKSMNHVQNFDPHLVKQFSLVCFSLFTQARCIKRDNTFLLSIYSSLAVAGVYCTKIIVHRMTW